MPTDFPSPAEASDRMLDPRVIDPHQGLVQYAHFDSDEIAQIVRLLTAIRRWRESEQKLNFESRTHMRLNETDMKALRYLVVAKNDGSITTPGALADHLHISSASTTKLLDRLEAAGHIRRAPHPSDRRALVVTISDETHRRVHESVGRRHARRFDVAAKLTPADRDVVIRFLNAMVAADQVEVPAAGSDDDPDAEPDHDPADRAASSNSPDNSRHGR